MISRKSIFLSFYISILLGIGGLLIYSWWWLQSFNYPSFLEHLTEIFQKPEWQEAFASKLTSSRFRLSKKLALGAVGIYWLLVIPFGIGKRKKIVEFLSDFWSWTYNGLRNVFSDLLSNLTSAERVFLVILFIISLAKTYWYIFQWPVQYDEAWTYNYYVSNGPLVPLIAPHNNHILYTIIAQWLSWLPFSGVENMRIILPVLGHLAALSVLLMVHRFFGKFTAILSVIIFLSSTVTVAYMLYARGYIFTIFFVVPLIWAAYNILTSWRLKEKPSVNNFWILALSGILGLYSMPVFIYPLITLFLVLTIGIFFFGRYGEIKRLGLTGIGVLLIAALLYSPMIASTGLEWLLGGKSAPNLDLLLWFKRTGNFLLFRTGSPLLYIAFMVGPVVLAFIQPRKKALWLLIAACFGLPVLALLLQNTALERRLFSYLVIPMVILLGTLTSLIFSRSRKYSSLLLIGISTILFAFNSFKAHHHHALQWSKPWDNSAERVAKILIKEQINEAYNFFFYIKPVLEYESKEKKQTLKVWMPQPGSRDYQAFDSQKNYPAVIWYKEYKGDKPDLSSYQLSWEDENVELWLR